MLLSQRRPIQNLGCDLALEISAVSRASDLTVALPVGATAVADRQWAEAFATALARIPAPNPFRTSVETVGDEFDLHVATGDATHLRDVAFFPLGQGVVDDGAPQRVVADANGLTLTVKRDTAKPPAAVLNGVLVFTDGVVEAVGATRAITITVPVDRPQVAGFAASGTIVPILLAFAGGIILNLMPCVLPVLSIKVLALVQHPGASSGEVRMQGAAYAMGVLASFAVIAVMLMALRAAGAEVGWGFQLQSPLFVAAMVYVLFAVGLNLSGVFRCRRQSRVEAGLCRFFFCRNIGNSGGDPVHGALHGSGHRICPHAAVVRISRDFRSARAGSRLSLPARSF
jgi:thiol:disulfide interchange protein DsbD